MEADAKRVAGELQIGLNSCGFCGFDTARYPPPFCSSDRYRNPPFEAGWTPSRAKLHRHLTLGIPRLFLSIHRQALWHENRRALLVHTRSVAFAVLAASDTPLPVDRLLCEMRRAGYQSRRNNPIAYIRRVLS